MFQKVTTAVICAVLITSCSETSNGSVVLGVEGSPAWARRAPEQDVKAHYDEMKTYELCTAWDRAVTYFESDKKIIRRKISESLVRRGERETLCYNPDRDLIATTMPARKNTYVAPQRSSVNCTSYSVGGYVNTTCN
jgi:hypothetical protein